jgi:RNA polymerase sigma-70 factor (ECF subfamily)
VKETFDRLYDEYHQALFQFLFYMVRNRESAEDLVQEVYIRVLNSYESFEGKSTEKTWLYSIARHVAIDWLRKQARRSKKFLFFDIKESENVLRDQDPLPEELVAKKEAFKDLYKMLKRCSFDQQQVLVLRYIQSLSIVETAQILSWTESRVKTTQHRAIKEMRKWLDQHPGLEEELKDGTN